MAKKTNGQNPVDEAYLRSLMAGGPSEPPSSPAPSITGESGGNRATALSDEKGKADNNVNGTVRDISGTDDTDCSNWLRINRHRKRFAPHWPTLSVSSSHLINAKADRGYI